jgi:adenosylhomocysteine nucleosidase
MTGILVPMPKEIEHILDEMIVEDEVEAGMRKYYVGTLYDKPVVVALSRIGKVAAAVTAAHMINFFDVKRMVVTGVAGGIGANVKIGDICIATECMQHDMNAAPLFPKYEIPLLDIDKFQTDSKMMYLGLEAAELFVNDYNDFITPELIENFGLEDVKIHSGLLASGDQFIGTHNKIVELKLHIPEMLFVEMEGAAVAQVCYEHQIPLLNIRTISDSANEDAHIDFQKFISKVAPLYTLGLMKNLLSKL